MKLPPLAWIFVLSSQNLLLDGIRRCGLRGDSPWTLPFRDNERGRLHRRGVKIRRPYQPWTYHVRALGGCLLPPLHGVPDNK